MPKRRNILENIKIDSIGYGGVGIATLEDGKKVLVNGGALPNSVVDIFVTRNKKDYIQGHITKITSYDKEYADGEIFCPHYFSHIGTKKNQVSEDKI
jgi:tRNA/tmRNA/rRNA uracil-C5-methylase (TrmA/RlmC/RlmD family)